MNISNLNGWLGAILTLCGIFTFFYKVHKALSASVDANKKRIQDLNDHLNAHDIALDEIIYYLSLPASPEGKKAPFNNNISLQNLRRKAVDNYDGRHTSGFK